jgi:predicted nucleic acid-binding protein
MACLDTTILIDLTGKGGARRKKAAESKLQELIDRDEHIVTTRFNIAELYVGIELSNDPRAEANTINEFLVSFEILDFSDLAAYLYGQITARQRKTGRPSGDMDVLIASTALAHGHSLITRDAEHFQNIPELKVEKY